MKGIRIFGCSGKPRTIWRPKKRLKWVVRRQPTNESTSYRTWRMTAKTIKKRKKLQEACSRMMTRLVVDWEQEKHQEEEAAFKRLEEAGKKKKKFCAKDVRTAEDDSQRQVTMGSSSMPEIAIMIKKIKLVEDDNIIMKQTKSSRQTPA